MRSKKNTIKNIFCCATGVAMLTAANVGLYHVINTNNVTYAASSGVSSLPVSISNSNFNSNTSYTMPFAPNSYKEQGNKGNIKAGVIKLTHTDYINKFTNAKRSSLLDEYVLMIDSDGNYANFGYTTSNAVKMSANSNYMLTVDVYTETNAGIANLYLYNEDGSIFSSIKNINSYANWTTYTFFVSTNEEAVNLKLGMTMEGNGIALFDNISCQQINNNLLNNKIDGLNEEVYEHVNNVDNVISSFVPSDNSFILSNDPLEKYNLTGLNALANDSLTTIPTETDGKNTGALKLSIDKDHKSYSAYETADNFLKFESNRLYKVTVTAKTENLNGKATLKLVQTGLEDGEKGTDSSAISISSNTGSSTNITNNYETYSFFVKSHPTDETSYKLQFGLGDSSSSTSGDLYITNVTVSKINYSTYSSASGTKNQKIDLTATENVSYDITNGQFNDIQIEDYNSRFPATPSSWTATKGTGAQHYGVINTADANFSKLASIGVTVNPYPTENNNVLLMCNEQKDTLIYTSATTNVTSNSYHRFDVNVQTFNSNVKVALVANKNDKEIELASKTISTDVQCWETVSLFLHTGYESIDVSLKITMDTESSGYAFIDNAYTNFPAKPTATQFNAKLNNLNDNEDIIDLSDMFASIDLFSQKGTIDTTKIIDMTTEDLSKYVPSENVGGFSSKGLSKVLAIRSLSDTNFTLTSNFGFSLTSDKYYKISVDVYTRDIDTNDSEADKSKIGASVSLTDIKNASFTQVISNKEWTTYTFYVKPSSSTTSYLSFSLGSEDALCKGDIYIGNIQIDDTITEDNFNNVSAGTTIKVIKPEQKETSEETPEEVTEETSNFNWIYLIPSIAFPLAIIICIVGVALRKIKWKKRVKKTKNTYDRNRTVSKQVLSRKATALREETLHDLNKDLEKLQEERAQYEEEYKHNLTKLREMKIKRANPAEIAKLEKDMKKNQKLTANIGVSVNRIKSEIEYVNTESYMNTLMKKLERQPMAEVEEDSSEEE